MCGATPGRDAHIMRCPSRKWRAPPGSVEGRFDRVSNSKPLRADAARNREAVVMAATVIFREQGLDVPIDEIARRAGVGSATLYRRFPQRQDLISAVFAERLRAHVKAVEMALAQPDPWSAFRDYVEHACEMQVCDRGLGDLVTMRVGQVPELERLRRRAYDGFVDLIQRAKRAGRLRQDFQPEDLVLVLMANAGLIERTHGAAPAASRRLAHVLLDGFTVEAATPGPPGPTRRSVASAMAKNASASGCS